MAEQEELIEEIINEKRDWSNLAPDIVNLIAKKLPNLLDFVRVHVTCKAWSYGTPLSDYLLCFPWLLGFHQNPDDPISAPITSLSLYSISCSETLTIPVKTCRWIRGTSHDYIPLYDDATDTICLFNPLTSDEFIPPRFNNSYRAKRWLALTGTGPIHDRRLLVVDHAQNFDSHNRWAIYDPQQGEWSEQRRYCSSYFYCHGRLFSITNPCHPIQVFDVISNKMLYEIPPPHEEKVLNGFPNGLFYDTWWSRKLFVVEACGEMLCIYCYYGKDVLKWSAFRIYKLVFAADEQPYWAKITSIDNQILFLDASSGFSLTATPANGLRGGRIYFIDQYEGRPYVYDVVGGTVQTVPCPFPKCTWFVPSLS